jgi:hypothetical protein
MDEYAITQGIDHKPAFNWWVPQVLQLRKRIISLVNKQKMSYLKKNLKFGIEVPVGHSGTFKAGNRMTDRCLVGDSYPQGHVRLKNRYSTWNVRQGREKENQNSHFYMLI